MVDTDDIECCREQWRYYARLRIQREDNESRNIRLARRRANYARQRQQTLGGDHILVGGPTNLNEEDVVHSNSTSTNPSLIPPNHEAGQSCRLTHIRNLAHNMPVEHRAMQEVSGLPPTYPTIMANDFEAGPSHINSDVNNVTERIEGVENIVEQNQGDAYREQAVERTEEVENINNQNHGDGYREQDMHNPFVEKFRQLSRSPNLHQCKLLIKEQPLNQPQYCLPNASQVAAIIVGGEEAGHLSGREILVQTFGGNLINVQDTAGFYDPLQYPILFPFGTYGWDINTRDANRNKVSCRDYYAYIFQIRDNAVSMIWLGGRLSQQYVVDNYVKIETHKLRWFEHNQDSIRADLYQGLQDAFNEGESDTGNVGHRTILPSSFVGSPRDMIERFQDAMSLVQKFGKPDLLITMTCNPGWEEIQSELLPAQTAQDRPDLLARVFKSKFEELKDDIVVKGVLGRVIVYVQVFEFQKRGLPHAHMLIILDEDDKLHNPDDYDRVVKAEIPCKEEQPHIKSVKYLYKYVYKGPDRVSMEVRPGPNYDEVQQYIDARWVCAPEACWKIFSFPMYRMYPAIFRLQIHLPDRQQVRFRSHEPIANVLERSKKTMLTEFFYMNMIDHDARNYVYREFPEHYCWDYKNNIWTRRRSHKKVVGRIYTVSPFDGEKFNLRVLLNHVKGPTGFDDLLTVNGITYQTFKQAAEQRGLLENDNSIRQCLLEARDIRMPSALRRLFATILVFCLPTGVRELWNEFYPYMVEDYPSTFVTTETHRTNKLLKDLRALLLQHGKHIIEYDLPISTGECDNDSAVPRLIQDELTVPNVDEELTLIEKLNNDQRVAFEKIMIIIDRKENMIFFIDGPGGMGKTFLYRTILATLRKAGHIAIATATSGIAATLLPGGRTAHSRFKIPLTPDASSTCSISKQSDLAELIRHATIIIWDEAPMVNRRALESLNRTFKDIMEVNLPFGGKVLILGGDFRQVLPVVPQGTRTEMIDACIVKSPLWKDVKVLHLKQNMRSINNEEFAEYIQRIGDGNEPFIMDDLIKLLPSMAMQWEGQHSIYNLIDQVFPNLQEHANDARYMVDRALLTPINDDVEQLNAKIISQFPGDEFTLHSFDEVEGDTHHLYQQEFLNSISPGGLPPHILRLKKGAPIMLLRNIDPKAGLCNGTRLICRGCFNNVIDAEILIGQYAGTRVFLPRIPLKTTENIYLPFVMIRRQFPVRLSFALTINKAQGQTIPTVEIYLPDHVFSHGQLYVALSRGVSQSTTKLLVQKGTILEEEGRMPNSNARNESTMLSNGVHAIPTTHWENWKDDQSLLNMEAIDNKVRKLEIYSPGWGFTIRADKKELWKEVKRVLESQKLERFVPFFKSQAEVDHFTYMELCNIITRFMANAAGKQLECGTNSIAPPTSPP
ncbi:uncharacterized protein LOC142625034 [Castanea sativa]|uniref:uncharacterized protein LOC142625034 n=1 Tax=Castanea sativa TaxID=21020 RepID=UPI003F64B82F